MTTIQDITHWCNALLNINQFQDYSPNGLQIEGKQHIQHIVCSVTASQAAIEFAASQNADMLLVHHGLFWKNEPITITGWKKRRIETLLKHNINLVGYHLPLDAHPQFGNNVQLAQKMGWITQQQTGEYNLLTLGHTQKQQTVKELQHHLADVLNTTPLLLTPDEKQNVHYLAWCTGGAQNFFQAAIDLGVQAFITGEVSEAQYHLANETGVAFIAAGHHATERYGVQALADAISQQFGISYDFFDDKNPA